MHVHCVYVDNCWMNTAMMFVYICLQSVQGDAAGGGGAAARDDAQGRRRRRQEVRGTMMSPGGRWRVQLYVQWVRGSTPLVYS